MYVKLDSSSEYPKDQHMETKMYAFKWIHILSQIWLEKWKQWIRDTCEMA